MKKRAGGGGGGGHKQNSDLNKEAFGRLRQYERRSCTMRNENGFFVSKTLNTEVGVGGRGETVSVHMHMLNTLLQVLCTGSRHEYAAKNGQPWNIKEPPCTPPHPLSPTPGTYVPGTAARSRGSSSQVPIWTYSTFVHVYRRPIHSARRCV